MDTSRFGTFQITADGQPITMDESEVRFARQLFSMRAEDMDGFIRDHYPGIRDLSVTHTPSKTDRMHVAEFMGERRLFCTPQQAKMWVDEKWREHGMEPLTSRFDLRWRHD